MSIFSWARHRRSHSLKVQINQPNCTISCMSTLSLDRYARHTTLEMVQYGKCICLFKIVTHAHMPVHPNARNTKLFVRSLLSPSEHLQQQFH
jgi:hypothetical protein